MPLSKRVPERVLVIKSRAIGDTILLTGPLRLLRKHLPRHQIHVLVRAPAGELLEGLPYVDRIISSKEPKEKLGRLIYWVKQIRRLREKRYDLCLNFHASFRTSLTGKFMRTELCVANHHELKGRNWFSDLPVPNRGKVKSTIDRDLDVLRAIGISAKVEDAMPEIFLSAAERREAEQFFCPTSAKGPRVFVGVGGSRVTKRWPADHLVALLTRLARELDAELVFSTVPSDQDWVREVFQRLESDAVFKGRLHRFENSSLRKTAQIISQCAVYVGNDSGLKHLAVALGLKSLTFFGPEAPVEWHPYDLRRHAYLFKEDLSCRTETGKHWCSIPTCPKHNHQCMRDLKPDMAWEKLQQVLKC